MKYLNKFNENIQDPDFDLENFNRKSIKYFGLTEVEEKRIARIVKSLDLDLKDISASDFKSQYFQDDELWVMKFMDTSPTHIVFTYSKEELTSEDIKKLNSIIEYGYEINMYIKSQYNSKSLMIISISREL